MDVLKFEEDVLSKDIIEDSVGDNSDAKKLKDVIQQFYSNYEYSSVPKIPEEYRGADIIGLRTRSTGTTSTPIGSIQPKAQLRKTWDGLTPVEKVILMYISEHRHLTAAQLKTLIVMPTLIRQSKGGGTNILKTYFKWVTETRYGTPLNYKETHKTSSVDGLMRKISHLKELDLIAEITPSYDVKPAESKEYKETPALFTQHYYLTPIGARVLVCNTAARVPSAKGRVTRVGYVPTYKNATYMSIVHETESTEVLCSIISCAAYISNMNNLDNANTYENDIFGFFDICRFWHEKDIEEKNILWEGKKIDFKSDGKLTLYSSQLGDFIDYFVEYDSGSSTPSKIKHKIEAFTKYILSNKMEFKDRFRKPILLLVTQKPADFIPSMARKNKTKYTSGIATMYRQNFSEYGESINDISIVLVADCNAIRQHGAMGACWHKIDLTTGEADEKSLDLIELSKAVVY